MTDERVVGLIALAERCEQASGPDRELDIAILTHPAIGYRDVHKDGRMFDRGNDGYWWVDDCEMRQLPSPTASIDAAMTLVPEGHFWSLTMRGEKRGGFHACCVASGGLVWHEATTPALALTAACLRALTKDQTDD